MQVYSSQHIAYQDLVFLMRHTRATRQDYCKNIVTEALDKKCLLNIISMKKKDPMRSYLTISSPLKTHQTTEEKKRGDLPYDNRTQIIHKKNNHSH